MWGSLEERENVVCSLKKETENNSRIMCGKTKTNACCVCLSLSFGNRMEDG